MPHQGDDMQQFGRDNRINTFEHSAPLVLSQTGERMVGSAIPSREIVWKHPSQSSADLRDDAG